MFAIVASGCPAYPALMRLVRDVVPPRRLDHTSAVAAGLESAAFLTGPALGGLLLTAGPSGGLLACVSMSVASAALAYSLPTVGLPIRDGAGESLRGAVGRLLGPGLRPAMLSVVGVNMLAGLVAVLLVRLPAASHLGGEREYGLLAFAQGVGACCAFVALLASVRLRRRPLAPLIVAGTAVAALAGGGALTIVLPASAVFGAAVMTSEVMASNAVCRDVPRPLVAPAFGILDASMVAAMTAGSMAAPVLVAMLGVRPSLVLVGVAAAAGATGVVRRRSPTRPRLGEVGARHGGPHRAHHLTGRRHPAHLSHTTTAVGCAIAQERG
jgi:hypothetical protein